MTDNPTVKDLINSGAAADGSTVKLVRGPESVEVDKTSGLAPATTSTPSVIGPVGPPYLFGIDVSHHQGLIDWATLESSGRIFGEPVRFAMIKVSGNYDYPAGAPPPIDTPTPGSGGGFVANYAGVHTTKILPGYYHFLSLRKIAADPTNGALEANFFMDQVEKEVKARTGVAGADPGSLPPTCDVEFSTADMKGWALTPTDITNIIAGISLWCSTVFTRWKQVPFIYSGVGNWMKMGNPAGFFAYPLWDAWYPAGAASAPPIAQIAKGPLDVSSPTKGPVSMVPVGFPDWRVWQYGSDFVAGITPKVDCNVFRFTLADLYAMAGLPAPSTP